MYMDIYTYINQCQKIMNVRMPSSYTSTVPSFTRITAVICGILFCGLSTLIIIVDSSMHLTQRNNHANISELLDNLLRGYDNSIRPGFGGKFSHIHISVYKHL